MMTNKKREREDCNGEDKSIENKKIKIENKESHSIGKNDVSDKDENLINEFCKIKINNFGFFAASLSNLIHLNKGEIYFKLENENLTLYAGNFLVTSKVIIPCIIVSKTDNFNSYIHYVNLGLLKDSNIFSIGFNCYVTFFYDSISIEVTDNDEETSYTANDLTLPYDIDDDQSLINIADQIIENKDHKGSIKVNPKNFVTQFGRIKQTKQREFKIELIKKDEDNKILLMTATSEINSVKCSTPNISEKEEYVSESAQSYMNNIKQEYDKINGIGLINSIKNEKREVLVSVIVLTEHLYSIIKKFDPTYLTYIEFCFNRDNFPIQIKITKDNNVYYSYMPTCYEDE